mmetsp:Transcript_11126/g.34347  ORF Transcript_11126/g.34347 Transcript_11126/m.34347 type:complete len:120 (-) Transcript_11126:255-614(-)
MCPPSSSKPPICVRAQCTGFASSLVVLHYGPLWPYFLPIRRGRYIWAPLPPAIVSLLAGMLLRGMCYKSALVRTARTQKYPSVVLTLVAMLVEHLSGSHFFLSALIHVCYLRLAYMCVC